LVGPVSFQFGLVLRRVRGLGASFAGLAAFAQQAVHGGLRAQVDALVQQDRPHLPWGLVGEARRVQHGQHMLAFLFGQFGGVVEGAAWAQSGRSGVAVPVQRGAGFPEDRACPGRVDCVFHAWEMCVDDMVQFASESALLEMS
jgi:hypothetical protein